MNRRREKERERERERVDPGVCARSNCQSPERCLSVCRLCNLGSQIGTVFAPGREGCGSKRLTRENEGDTDSDRERERERDARVHMCEP